MEYYTVRNWRRFQHYKDRNPPWIKLHFELLASESWVMLDDASRVLAVACMLIASRNNGLVPNSPDYLKRVAYLNKPPNFKPLIDIGFLESASDCKQMLADARPERETEEETETDNKPIKKNGQSNKSIEKPDDVSNQIFADFLRIRAAKKAPLTETAMSGIRDEASKAGISLEDALKVCCLRGWQGFKAEWHKGNSLPQTETKRPRKELSNE